MNIEEQITLARFGGRTSLNSSCLAWVEYASGAMRLGFRSGSTYTLRGVPERHYYGLLNASSPGRYFNTYLKGRY